MVVYPFVPRPRGPVQPVTRRSIAILSAALITALVIAPGAAAIDLVVAGDGWRLRLPEGFQPAPSSRGKDLQARIQGLIKASGLPVTGEPGVRAFLRFGTNVPSTLVVLRYRVPDGVETPTLDPDALGQAWDVAVGASGRQKVKDVRADELNTLLPMGLQATLHEVGRDGAPRSVRLAMVANHGQIVVLAYEAPAGTDLEHTAVWHRLLGSLRVVEPSVDWMLYIKYGGFIAGGLFLLLLGWWLVLRPRRGPRYPGANPLGESGIRVMDGMGTYDELEAASPEPEVETRPLLDVLAEKHPEPAGAPEPDLTGAPTMGESWDPADDPAFATPPPVPAAEPEEDEAPLRPQMEYGATSAPAPVPPSKPAVEAAPEPAAQAAETAEAGPDEKPAEDAKLRISRNLDFIS